MHQHVCFRSNFKCALERFDESVWQTTNETNGVGEENWFTTRESETSGGGVERCKQSVFHQCACTGERVEQG